MSEFEKTQKQPFRAEIGLAIVPFFVKFELALPIQTKAASKRKTELKDMARRFQLIPYEASPHC
jgi:hypothetical protein